MSDATRLPLVCDCGHAAHMIMLEYYPPEGDDDFDFVSVSVLLNHKMPWYRRVPRAIKYLLGKDTWRTWDEVLLTNEDCVDMIAFLRAYLYLVKEQKERIK